MPLGPNEFNATIALESVFCFQGSDIHDFFDEESEPFLWVIMVKIDGEGLQQQGNLLSGQARFFFSPGSHGNIGGSIVRGTRRIPEAVGTWHTSLKPITLSAAGQSVDVPGFIICAAILLEEGLTPNSAVEAAHGALNSLIQTTTANTIGSIGIAGVIADALAEFQAQQAQGNTVTLAAAANTVLNRRLRPIRDLFGFAVAGTVTITALQQMDFGGMVGTAIDSDKPMGVFSRTFTQGELARTFTEAPGMPQGGTAEINGKMWNMPNWAYTLHGRAFAHHRFLRRALPVSNRLQVTCSSKRPALGERRITGIGGVDGGTAWSLGRAEAADMVNRCERAFFVRGPGAEEVEVRSVQGGFAFGRPWFFLQTPADQHEENNLVNLPNCDPGAGVMEIWE